MGGASTYCISEGQLKSAFHLAEKDPEASPRILKEIHRLESTLTRNERAAVAFVIIERLRMKDN